MTTVCSGCSPLGLKEYGLRFLNTFHRYWPENVNLLFYTEEPTFLPRGTCHNLWDCGGARDFYQRHRLNPERCGKAPIPGWRQKDRRVGYSWRFDAVRFFKQCMIPAHAASLLPDDEILVWLDGDVVTFTDVPENVIDLMLGKADLAFLGRGAYHSEIGFWAVRLNERSRKFVDHLAEIYSSDEFLKEGEHHSAFIFDRCRMRGERKGLVTVNLTPAHATGHVLVYSPIGQFIDHTKGDRKHLGYSPEHPLKWWVRASS